LAHRLVPSRAGDGFPGFPGISVGELGRPGVARERRPAAAVTTQGTGQLPLMVSRAIIATVAW
jgi:hypothetical protein